MARALTAGVLAEIVKQTIAPIILYDGEFNSGTIHLWSGVGGIVWNGNTYTGAGQVMGLSAVEETIEVRAAGMSFSLSGLPAATVSLALNDARQGKKGRVWLGFIGRVALDSGTAQAGASSSLTLRAAASAATSAYNGRVLRLTDGSDRERRVIAYDGVTKIATVDPRWQQNLVKWSEDFTNAVWVVGDAVNPKIPNSADIAAPDGTFTACKWVLNQTAGVNRSFGGSNFGVAVPGQTNVFSFFVYVPSSNSANPFSAYMFASGDVPNDPINLNAAPRNQWTLASYVHTWAGGASGGINPQFHSNSAETVGDKIYVWKPKLELASVAGDYIKSAASAIALPDSTTTYDVLDENAIIADPYLIFTGLLDVPTMSETGETADIAISYENRLVGLLNANDRRYTPEDQHVEFPGDTGFDYVAGLQDQTIIW